MHFGRRSLTDIQQIDFSLPDVPSGLPGVPSEEFTFFFGPPTFGHKHWEGSLYPAGLSAGNFYTEVVKHFNFMELNASFFGNLKPENVTRWMNVFGQYTSFKVSPKFPCAITHIKRLKGVEQQTEQFIQLCRLFGSNFGFGFMQLHDKWGPENLEVLKDYLQILPADLQTHVELRHPGWFKGEIFEATTDLFKRYQIGTVISDTNERRDVLHMTLTTKKAYIRFNGNNNDPSDRVRLEAWAVKIKQWKDEGVQEVYFSLHQPQEELFPESAAVAKEVFKDLLPVNTMLAEGA